MKGTTNQPESARVRYSDYQWRKTGCSIELKVWNRSSRRIWRVGNWLELSASRDELKV